MRYQARNPKNGAYEDREKTVEDCPSPAKAAQIRDALIRTAESGNGPKRRTNLATFGASWLLEKEKTLSPSTYKRYETALDLHIVPALGAYFLDAITHEDIVKWRDRGAAQNPTVNGWLRVLKGLMKAATVQHDLAKDPSQYVSALPEDPAYGDEFPNLLGAEELAIFLDGVKRYRPNFHPLFATLGYTGMRFCEASSLKWTDLIEDPSGKKIIVRRSNWMGHIKERTKTGTWRAVPLPSELAQILTAHRQRLVAKQHPHLDKGWVFLAVVRRGKKGILIIHSTARNTLIHVLKKLEGEGVPEITVHGLRRTFNNLLRQHASKEVVKAITGHVTDEMFEHYSHVGLAEKSAAVSRVVTFVRVPNPNEKTGS